MSARARVVREDVEASGDVGVTWTSSLTGVGRLTRMERLELDPGGDARALGVWTFAEVTNAREVCERVRRGEVGACVMDASVVVGRRQLRVAGYRAATARARGDALATSDAGELACAVSPTRHVREAYRRFGPRETSVALVVCRLDPTPEDEAAVLALVRGRLASFDERGAVDEGSIRKWYKINDEELALGGTLEDAVISRMAIRDVV